VTVCDPEQSLSYIALVDIIGHVYDFLFVEMRIIANTIFGFRNV